MVTISSAASPAAAENSSGRVVSESPRLEGSELLRRLPTSAGALAGAIKLNQEFPDPVPGDLQRDPTVQKATVAKFREWLTAAAGAHFAGRFASAEKEPYSTSCNDQASCLRSAQSLAEQFSIADHSRDHIVNTITKTLLDLLDQTIPETGLPLCKEILKIASTLGVENEVLSAPVIKARATGWMDSLLKSSLSLQVDPEEIVAKGMEVGELVKTFQLGLPASLAALRSDLDFDRKRLTDVLVDPDRGSFLHIAGQIIRSFPHYIGRLQTALDNDQVLLGVLRTRLDDLTQRHHGEKHADLFRAVIHVATSLGLGDDFVRDFRVKNIARVSIREALATWKDVSAESIVSGLDRVGAIARDIELDKRFLKRIVTWVKSIADQRFTEEDKETVLSAVEGWAKKLGV